jgi:hypothetical protein
VFTIKKNLILSDTIPLKILCIILPVMQQSNLHFESHEYVLTVSDENKENLNGIRNKYKKIN